MQTKTSVQSRHFVGISEIWGKFPPPERPRINVVQWTDMYLSNGQQKTMEKDDPHCCGQPSTDRG